MSLIKLGFRIFQLLAFLILLVHWVACLWYLIVKEIDSWVPPKDLDSGETDFYDLSMWAKYSVVFYYAILLLVGNESAPRTSTQTVFAQRCG